MLKIKLILCFAFAVLITASFSYSQDSESVTSSDSRSSKEAEGTQTDSGILYGNEISTYENVIGVNDLINAAEKYDGSTIVVRGEITDVCQAMGCWLVISSGTGDVRVKTNHEFFVPGDIVGQAAVVEGIFRVAELSEDEANHYSAESLNKAKEIKGTVLELEIDATGIVVLHDEVLETKPVE